MTPAPHRRDHDDQWTAVSDVLAEVLRPPYVWWFLIAMVLQAYSPVYVAPVAAAIVAATVGCARHAVRGRLAPVATDSVPVPVTTPAA